MFLKWQLTKLASRCETRRATTPGFTLGAKTVPLCQCQGARNQRDLGTIHYARSRTYLRDGFPSSQADRERLQADVIGRLRDDVDALDNGKLKSSEEEPIFIRSKG